MDAEGEASETSPLLKTGDAISRSDANVYESTISQRASTSTPNDVERQPSDGERRAAQFTGNVEMQKRLKYILPAVGVGVFLCAADQTIIVSSYGRIGSDLHALNLTSFIATSYFLSLTSIQPLFGKLSDIFGRKTCLLYSYAIFGLGCLFCGLSRNIYELIASRVFQGIGGSGMTTVTSILFSDIVSLKDRGMWQGILNLIYAAGSAAGAPLGGALSDFVSWRFAFLFQTPLCLLAFIAVLFTLKLPAKEKTHWKQDLRRIDYTGALILVCAVTGLLFGLDRGSNVSWKSPFCYGPLSASIVFFALFIFVETKVATEPFAPVRIIFDRSMVAAFLCNFFSMAAWIAMLYYLPLFWQAADDVNATTASIRLIPTVCASVTGSLFAGFMMRRTGKYYWLTICSYAMLSAGTLMILLFSGVILNDWRIIIVGTVLGAFGNGNGVTTVLIALISNGMPEDQAIITACSYLFRSLGSAIGVSLSATAVQQALRDNLRRTLGSGAEADEIERNVRQSLDYLKKLDPETQMLVRQAYEKAVGYGYGIMLILALGAFLSGWFIKEKRLSQ